MVTEGDYHGDDRSTGKTKRRMALLLVLASIMETARADVIEDTDRVTVAA